MSEHKFHVTVSGKFRINGNPATKKQIEKMLRDAVRGEFEFLARTSVKPVANHPASTDQSIEGE